MTASERSHAAELAANRANWDARAVVHLGPHGYDVEALRSGARRESDVVLFDLPLLGDLTGLDVVHLQCHIGTDTVSLANHGARVTGLDFSPVAIEAARALAADLGHHDARFVVSDVHDAPVSLGATFDLVYTGIGALCWLPDVRAWARVVAACLKPGGRLHITETHPVLFTLDEASTSDTIRMKYPYFEVAEPLRWDDPSTYSGDGTPVSAPLHFEWGHGLAEIVQAVLDAGLRLTLLRENTSVPWRAFPWLEDDPEVPGHFRLPEGRERVPLTFTLQATKSA